jgi:hypothetical protein
MINRLQGVLSPVTIQKGHVIKDDFLLHESTINRAFNSCRLFVEEASATNIKNN